MPAYQGLAAACAALVLAACAANTSTTRDPRDPLERVNRATHGFNEALDRSIAKPAARAYRKVTPGPVQTGISNLMNHAEYPTVFVNDLLQAKFPDAARDLGRLLLNSTLGLGGLLDPASAAGLDANDEDFGQTLGKWGVPPGPYLVLPLVGPSTIRDAFGRVPDEFTDARQYIENDSVKWGVQGLRQLDRRARLLEVESTLKRTFDPYTFVRNAYLRRREFKVTDGAVSEQEPDDLDEDVDDDPDATEPDVRDEPSDVSEPRDEAPAPAPDAVGPSAR